MEKFPYEMDKMQTLDLILETLQEEYEKKLLKSQVDEIFKERYMGELEGLNYAIWLVQTVKRKSK